jgi:hypothetical protein
VHFRNKVKRLRHGDAGLMRQCSRLDSRSSGHFLPHHEVYLGVRVLQGVVVLAVTPHGQ